MHSWSVCLSKKTTKKNIQEENGSRKRFSWQICKAHFWFLLCSCRTNSKIHREEEPSIVALHKSRYIKTHTGFALPQSDKLHKIIEIIGKLVRLFSSKLQTNRVLYSMIVWVFVFCAFMPVSHRVSTVCVCVFYIWFVLVFFSN